MSGLVNGLFGKPKADPAQQALIAQQQATLDAQSQSIEAEKQRLANAEAAETAARAARQGRNAGRALLLDDELGVTDSATPLQKNLGS